MHNRVVYPSLDSFLNFIKKDCPDVIPRILEAANTRLDSITALVKKHPNLPASILEATLEKVVHELGEYNFTPNQGGTQNV